MDGKIGLGVSFSLAQESISGLKLFVIALRFKNCNELNLILFVGSQELFSFMVSKLLFSFLITTSGVGLAGDNKVGEALVHTTGEGVLETKFGLAVVIGDSGE
jgi:hypothetical protein